jgi:hypothetical protein
VVLSSVLFHGTLVDALVALGVVGGGIVVAYAVGRWVGVALARYERRETKPPVAAAAARPARRETVTATPARPTPDWNPEH